MPNQAIFFFSCFCKFPRMFIMGCFIWIIFSVQPAWAQQDPEFPKGGVIYAHLSQGVTTAFDRSPDNYLISLDLNPQYTVAPGLLRLGLKMDAAYTQKQWYFVAGPMAAIKLGNITADPLGTLGNYQILLNYLWGSYSTHLVGGGLRAEIAQLFTLSVLANRNYSHDQWWFQTTLGINLFPQTNKNEAPFSKNF